MVSASINHWVHIVLLQTLMLHIVLDRFAIVFCVVLNKVESILIGFLFFISFLSGTCFLNCRDIQQIGSNSHAHSTSNRTAGVIQAVAFAISPSLQDDEKRQQMCESYGFTQIGEPLPDNITLKDVMDTLPKKVPALRVLSIN